MRAFGQWPNNPVLRGDLNRRARRMGGEALGGNCDHEQRKDRGDTAEDRVEPSQQIIEPNEPIGSHVRQPITSGVADVILSRGVPGNAIWNVRTMPSATSKAHDGGVYPAIRRDNAGPTSDARGGSAPARPH